MYVYTYVYELCQYKKSDIMEYFMVKKSEHVNHWCETQWLKSIKTDVYNHTI